MTSKSRASLFYERHNDALRLKSHGLTNHELREILVGCWASLDDDDKADHIKELQHYSMTGSQMSDVATAVMIHIRGNKAH